MYSLLIKNATVYDGTGKPGEAFDVAVQGDEIVNVAKDINTNAELELDATGKALMPGFIDVQNHSDSYWQIFDNPTLDSLTTQGYTTILLGNCGASLAPLLSPQALYSIQKWHSLEGINVNWQSFSEFIETLSKNRFACNVASLVGYSTLRRGLLGDEVRSLEKGELELLKRVLKESMEAGAFGLSSGLSYAHEVIISELELFELAKVVSKEKGLFSIHLRNEGSEVLEALDEALEIARTTELNLKISHLKIGGQHNWDKFEPLVTSLDTAYHRGMNVHFDMYPYDRTWQVLYSYLPKWAMEGGRSQMLKHFAQASQKNKIISYLNSSGVKFSELFIASTANKLNFMGKSVGQIAKNMEVSSQQAVLEIIQNGGSEVMVFEKNLNSAQVRQLMTHPLSFIGSDGGGFSRDNNDRLVHPRCFGSATKFLYETVAGKLLPIEEAVHKLTLGPAEKVGIKKRGAIKIGNFADLVLADLNKISDKADYENPYQYSTGMDYVFVNGKAVVEKGQPTGNLPGYALRKK